MEKILLNSRVSVIAKAGNRHLPASKELNVHPLTAKILVEKGLATEKKPKEPKA